MEGRAIDTLGYRGMHSYEVAFDDWHVPGSALIGGEGGLGKGFYLQMEGFENGRLQTAARAVGVMQAAYEAALQYSQDRKVFGNAVGEYELTKVKLGRMAGQFHWVHVMAIDSKGNLYTGEVDTGKRIQKFTASIAP